MKRREFLAGSAAIGGLSACSPQTKSGSLLTSPTLKPEPVLTLDATAQAGLIAKGEVTSLEFTQAAIARANETNRALNFLVTSSFEQARTRAASHLPEGPFSGVPTLTKDLTVTKGVRTAFGSKAFVEYIPKENDGFANVMQDAGLVSIGKSATPEFGFLPTTEPLAFGPTRNPWNPEHSTGGSSGGAAAAVAAGVVPIAQASDGGGSIRIPANCCGLFGMKASRGRWPDADGSDWEISIRGFVSRTVRDSQNAMIAMGAKTDKLPEPVLADAGRNKKYKIGIRTQTPDGRQVHPDCKNAVLLAANHCAALGHEVVEVSAHYSWDEFWEAFMTVWAFGAKQGIGNVAKQMGKMPPRELFEPFSWWLYDLVAGKDSSVLASAYAQFAAEREAARKFHQTFDFQLTPVLGAPAIKIGQIDQSGDLDAMRDWLEHYVGFTPWANATGHPAMSVPILRTAEHIPVGVQFEADYGDEANLFELARQLEQIAPWAQNWPNMVHG
ncbi:Aspartyl-tRNA(Asn) amidotransferase subunit A @ Glutamyl-tRNA(Gln) amidotransferase subunit A [hydrothermal vent metagenome]|uniref:Aspartyl-tRNA(Asn) amidotransferase subunit A @ Glutamyl-tRNA(Gln) amidotransferase subunit A n=1 Tax=hydrothermal vent metagenome TaxID=652676 RepID=A0A3B0RZU4_9ZZZZ